MQKKLKKIRWEVRLLPICEKKVILVKGVPLQQRDVWYAISGRDQYKDKGPEQTAQRALLDMTGIAVDVMQFSKHSVKSKEAIDVYTYTVDLSNDDMEWMRSKHDGITPSLHTKEAVLLSPARYGKLVRDVLTEIGFLNSDVPTKSYSFTETATDGVCSNGHPGVTGGICTHENCAGSPFRR